MTRMLATWNKPRIGNVKPVMKAAPFLQVAGAQARMLRDAAQDLAAEFVIIVEGKFVVPPTFAGQYLVRTTLPLDAPADALQGGQDAASLSRRPVAHSTPERKR